LAREASGDVLLLLNNDTRPEGELLCAFAEAWRRAPEDVAALAGRLVDWQGERLDFGRGIATFDGHAFALDQGRPLSEARLPAAGEELLFGCGGNLWVRRSSFLEAGGFDTSYFAYFEDVDFGWRLWAGGERILACPEAVARHRLGATSARLGDARRGAMFERNALLTVAKNFEDGLWERMMPPVLLTFLSRLGAMSGAADPAGAPSGRRARWAARLRRLADRIAVTPRTGGTRLPHPQAAAQIGGLVGFLAALDPLAAERARLARRRRRSDLELFGRFPLWIVPTYPGDEALFGSPSFTAWLPPELVFERSTLEAVMRPG
jgi:hypothetical protein